LAVDRRAVTRTSRPVRQKNSTPLALIEAAERLFGRYGIEAVSLRQINAEAAIGNKSAIHYHFGDRIQLVRAIWEYRLPVLESRRSALLREARERGTLGDPETLLAILSLPTYEVVDAQGGHSYAAFFRQALRWRPGRSLRDAAMEMTPSSV